MSQEYGAPPVPRRGLPIWAWFVIVPCGCLVLMVPVVAILAAILFPVFAQAREKARGVTCMSNIKQDALGVLMYSQDYDDVYPSGKAWMDVTTAYTKETQLYRCPSVPQNSGDVYGYAYNSRLSRLPAKKITAPNTMPMIYDSTNLSRNATDAVSSLPSPGRHARRNMIGYVDGHARSVAGASNASVE